MIVTDLPTLRIAVDRLQRTRNAIAAASDDPETGFDQNAYWMHPCGTPACTLGFAAVACPDVFRIVTGTISGWRICVIGDDDYLRGDPAPVGLNISKHWGYYLTGVVDQGSPGISQPRIPGRAGALARLDRILTIYRRRIAALEVEQGEWGRPLRASVMPVGDERERLTRERVGQGA